MLIYLQAQNEGTKSATLSTLTNREGRWSLDLGNLRTSDLTKGFSINSKTEEVIIAQIDANNRFKAQTKSGFDQPWPDIILSPGK